MTQLQPLTRSWFLGRLKIPGVEALSSAKGRQRSVNLPQEALFREGVLDNPHMGIVLKWP